MIGRGVAAGASNPYQEPASKPGRPDSATVGTSVTFNAALAAVNDAHRRVDDTLASQMKGLMGGMGLG